MDQSPRLMVLPPADLRSPLGVPTASPADLQTPAATLEASLKRPPLSQASLADPDSHAQGWGHPRSKADADRASLEGTRVHQTLAHWRFTPPVTALGGLVQAAENTAPSRDPHASRHRQAVATRKGSEEAQAARAKAPGPGRAAGHSRRARRGARKARSSKVLRIISLEMENLTKHPRLHILSSLPYFHAIQTLNSCSPQCLRAPNLEHP